MRLEDGTFIRARTVLCNADPKVALDLLTEVPDDYRDRLEAWKVRSPVVKFNAALTALPEWTAAPGAHWPAQATIDLTGGLEEAQTAFEACDRGEPSRRLRRALHPDRLRPDARARRTATCCSVFGQYAPVRARPRHLGRPPRRGRDASSST